MGMSDLIADFIISAMSEQNGVAELQRRDLAERFNCVPSQINYVIATRFSPEHGYIVESRRGGGGYIRIRRVRFDKKSLLMHALNAIGEEIDLRSAVAFISNLHMNGAIDEKTAKIINAAVSENALRPVFPDLKNLIRANILKQILINSI